jgi:hypothetical protein
MFAVRKRPFLTHLFDGPRTRSVLPFDLQIEESEMASENPIMDASG